jgi:hypothetical protein
MSAGSEGACVVLRNSGSKHAEDCVRPDTIRKKCRLHVILGGCRSAGEYAYWFLRCNWVHRDQDIGGADRN